MTIYNLGSINADRFYAVPHLPKPGETLAATTHSVGLGGKGANQSIAAAKAGARVVHIGAVGPDGDWAVTALRDAGVDVSHIAKVEVPTGHAIINVDPAGENAIVIFSSANTAQTETAIDAALSSTKKGDFLVLQNETNLIAYAANVGKLKGLRVVYSAAPFNADAVREVLPTVDMLVVNEVEADQLATSLAILVCDLPVPEILITRGSKGSAYQKGDQLVEIPAFQVVPVDTTGAGDTYLGYLVAGLDLGKSVPEAMRFAAAAAAIQVTRRGTADAIPNVADTTEFLRRNASE